MSVLAEYKEFQKRIFGVEKYSEEFWEISDCMDVLWIRLSTAEQEETNEYWRELLMPKEEESK